MEPRIQYAKTRDGVSIAYSTLGEGMPLVYMPNHPWSHTQVAWQTPVIRSELESLAEKRKVIGYDGRGSGLSEREVSEHSLDAQLLDLEGVVDHLGLERFALLGFANSGPTAIAYAARSPKRLSHLILFNAYARGADFLSIPQLRALLPLVETDWEMFTETMAHAVMGWSADEPARRMAAFLRECTTPRVARADAAMRETLDVTELLPQVSTPTLVIQHRQMPFPNIDIARSLASRIPNARLTVLEGHYGADSETQARAIHEFLGEDEEAATDAPTAGTVHTILFTDVEGSTALTQRLGDAKARDLLREHERIVREALKAHGGSEVKTMGDGFMTSFSSATKALECAIAIQRAFAKWNAGRGGSRTAPAPEPIRVRIGLNAGEPIAEDEDLFGTAVNLAARICAHAEAGQILAPIVVRELAAGKQFLFADLGETALRGFEDPVRLFEVSWRKES